MKRLKYYILNMKPASEAYEEMYEGKMYESFMDKDPIVHNHAVYWDGEIGYEITKSSRLELSKPTVTIHIPMRQLGTDNTKIPALDYMFRRFIPYIHALNEQNDNRKRSDVENGHYYIYEPNSKVLVRNVVTARMVPQKYYRLLSKNTIEPIDGLRDRGVDSYKPGKNCMLAPMDNQREIPVHLCVSIMIQVQLPRGKHKKAVEMLCFNLPEAVNRYVEEFDREGMEKAAALYEKQEAIRVWLRENNCCAFVANGSILPRAQGCDLPLQGAVPFLSTPEDEVEAVGVRGMVFRKGVTVITGGGYSGKSTLLDALSAGIYNHIGGDGRELVITEASAMKISAEDGRRIRHGNLSPFIKWIPGGDPGDFSTEHASGSTSQAANIMEAVNWGSKLLMIDEDKSATNFMIQDSVMKALIEKEPITPFVERVQELSQDRDVSSILVIGGSSEYLQTADRIYMMKDYRISHMTEAAKALQAEYAGLAGKRENAALEPADFTNPDKVDANYLSTRPEGTATEVLRVSDLGFLILGEERVDIRMLHDIVSIPQLNAMAFLLRRLMGQLNPLERFQKFIAPGSGAGGGVSGIPSGGASDAPAAPKWVCLEEEVDRLLEEIEREGLESVFSPFFTECIRWMDLPRKYELLAVLSRMRLDC
ncbi:MAG: ABC-ATPase domain-containing protein [Acetatifactor sp.]|nr:ABC-ATPase domain-containing protein [Acetatifactor sp.]